MKVLLTGASGFVGSHILDRLLARGLDVALLLRPTSSKAFLEQHSGKVELRVGSIDDAESLRRALSGVSQVIHCAGCTQVVRTREFYEGNHLGTRRVVEAVNSAPEVIRLLHVSSLAVSGPATAARPALEQDPPRPVSHYGKSKLLGEDEVRNNCRKEYVIVRPPAVFGPRDPGFLSAFQAVSRHILPRTSAGQAMSVVYAGDLAEAIVACLEQAPAGSLYFAAARRPITGREMAEEIARHMKTWTVPLPLPVALFWPVCLWGQLWAQVTRKPSLLSLQKFAELRAPGWVCDPSRLERELGIACSTPLAQGIAETIEWYRREGWL